MHTIFPGRGTGANQYASLLATSHPFLRASANALASRSSRSAVSRARRSHGPSMSSHARGFDGRSAAANSFSQSRRCPLSWPFEWRMIPNRGVFHSVSCVAKEMIRMGIKFQVQGVRALENLVQGVRALENL